MRRSLNVRRVVLALVAVMVWGTVFPTIANAQDDTNPGEGDIDFPIATHYPNLGDGEPTPKRGAGEVAYGVYHNRETDYYAPDRGKVDFFVNAARLGMRGAPLRLLNDFDAAEEGIEAVQVINNVPIAGALYTIFLPPGWVRDGNYPVVLSGNGAGTSNNRRLYGDMEIYAPIIVWNSTQAERGGLILAISNCGGTESQGIDEPTLRSVGAFYDFIAENGGDKYNAVTTGGSRGGGTALVWAANPLDLDYTVRAAFAHVPPTHYGTLGTTSIITYPALGGIADLVLGEGGSRFDEGPSTMETRLQEALSILAGTGDVEAANARGAIGLAEQLRGKQIAISEGTHDGFFQLALFLAFDRRLTELDIDHATAIILGDGHNMSTWLYDLTLNYLDAIASGEEYTVPSGRFYFIKTDEGQVRLEDFLGAPVEELPFTVEIPARSGVGLPIDVSACGGVGREFSITVTGPGGDVAWEASEVLDETECATFRLDTPQEVGVYTWAFTYDGETIPSTYTPFRDNSGCGVEAVTVVEAEQPSLENTFYRPGYLSFGIDQFSAQGEDCD